jgi:hypothetical protein
VIYVQTTGTQQAGFGAPQPIPGLSLTIPAGAGDQALVILNVPNPEAYTTPGNSGGGWFGISVNGVTSPTVATFTFTAPTMGGGMYIRMRVPTTLVIAVPLADKPQTIVAQWRSLGQGLSIDSPASLSAVFG